MYSRSTYLLNEPKLSRERASLQAASSYRLPVLVETNCDLRILLKSNLNVKP
jgi:hypothetical protein